jgi:N-acetylglucosamine malate deacetylase 1
MKGSLLQCYAGQTVLALGAHPDDVEMGMGGTVARLVDLGARVIVAAVCVPSLFEQRVREARRACEILGAEFHLICDQGALHVEDLRSYELVARLDRLLRELKPVALFGHGSADLHRDHQLVSDAFRASLRIGGIDGFCYQPCGCRPGPCTFVPRAHVDISATLDRKIAALGAHRSQFGARGLDIEFIRDVARYYGSQAGVSYAEGLDVVKLELG